MNIVLIAEIVVAAVTIVCTVFTTVQSRKAKNEKEQVKQLTMNQTQIIQNIFNGMSIEDVEKLVHEATDTLDARIKEANELSTSLKTKLEGMGKQQAYLTSQQSLIQNQLSNSNTAIHQLEERPNIAVQDARGHPIESTRGITYRRK